MVWVYFLPDKTLNRPVPIYQGVCMGIIKRTFFITMFLLAITGAAVRQ